MIALTTPEGMWEINNTFREYDGIGSVIESTEVRFTDNATPPNVHGCMGWAGRWVQDALASGRILKPTKEQGFGRLLSTLLGKPSMHWPYGEGVQLPMWRLQDVMELFLPVLPAQPVYSSDGTHLGDKHTLPVNLNAIDLKALQERALRETGYPLTGMIDASGYSDLPTIVEGWK